MTASTSHNLKLWTVGGVSSLKLTGGRQDSSGMSGLVMEDEIILDGAVTCAKFDDTLDMVSLCFIHM